MPLGIGYSPGEDMALALLSRKTPGHQLSPDRFERGLEIYVSDLREYLLRTSQ